MKKKIFITGATGFLGSSIAEELVNNGITVIALKRKSSDCWRCEPFNDKIKWVDIDFEGAWKQEIVRLKPTHIIHGAWIGVGAEERDDLQIQFQNIAFLVDLLEVAQSAKIEQFIGLGSQAEYGLLDKIVSENETVNPTTLYGATKAASQQIVKTFCELNLINWLWLRLFSFIGERENDNWLIPSLVNAITNGESLNMSLGNQKYSYMYVGDFSKIILQIIQKSITSGIYNVSASSSVSLIELVSIIESYFGTEAKINWGALPYRKNQSMLIQGNMEKLSYELGEIKLLNINEIIAKVVFNKTNIK